MQEDLLAEQVQQASDRAQKWKGRCAKLRQDLLRTQTTAASLQAAVHVSCIIYSCILVSVFNSDTKPEAGAASLLLWWHLLNCRVEPPITACCHCSLAVVH